jgi:hypothetical protein
MMLVEECRESLCAETFSEDTLPQSYNEHTSNNRKSVNIEFVSMTRQSDIGSLPQPFGDSRSCTVNTYRIVIAPLAASDHHQYSSSGGNLDLVSGDVVLLSGGGLDR